MQSRSKILKTVLVLAALALSALARVHAAPPDQQVPIPRDGGARDDRAPRPTDNDKSTGPKQGMGGTSGGAGGVTGSGGAGGVGGGSGGMTGSGGTSGGAGGMSGSGGVGGVGGGGGMSGYGPGPMKPTAH
jgi:hypothetical protein